ncbi:unnamed protein product [Symbiodinium sp. KB8]|nr:unnamed protein product [Symbiodinium sp. KB8]
MQGAWQVFVTRHETLLAQQCPDTLEHPSQEPPTLIQEESHAPPGPGIPSDEEADMVERAALRRAASLSSVSSSVSSTASQTHMPFVVRAEFSARFACMGPWGRWHALSLDGPAGQTSRTACGMELGIAAQVSEFPQVNHLLVHHSLNLYLFLNFGIALSMSSKGIEGPEALEELLSSLQVPEQLCTALKSTGIQSIPDFAFAYNEVAELSRFCDASTHAQLWQDLGIDEPEHSPAMARLRRAWHRCKALAQAAEAPVSSSETSTAPQLPMNSWAEHAPPRLDATTIAQLTKDFQSNYPGEHLDGDAMPSVRLLTLPGKRKEPGTGTAPEVKTSDLVKEHNGRAAVIVKRAGDRCRDGTLHSIAPSAWQAFYDCLDATGQLSRTPPGSWLPRNGRVLEVGSLKISGKADVPRVPPSHKRSWVRIFDPHRGEIHLRQESKFVLEWLRHCFAHEQPRSLRAAPLLHCLSAADAFADKHRVGIGGWLTTSKRYFWYSEIFTAEQVRQQWPQLSGSLQPYIGCFEALAQLALAQCVWQALRSKHVRFVLPSASDNTSAESGLNKLFSTAEPLGTFLRLAATWAHLHRVQFQVEHRAGEKNTWADKLSRGSIDFMQRRSADRVRITLSQLASASHSVSLHGTATQWPNTLLQAQHEMLK